MAKNHVTALSVTINNILPIHTSLQDLKGRKKKEWIIIFLPHQLAHLWVNIIYEVWKFSGKDLAVTGFNAPGSWDHEIDLSSAHVFLDLITSCSIFLWLVVVAPFVLFFVYSVLCHFISQYAQQTSSSMCCPHIINDC